MMPRLAPGPAPSAMIRIQAGTFAAVLAMAAALAAQQQQNNAGYGGIYRQLDLEALSGNRAHLGVADVGGDLFVSARDPNAGGTNHVIYKITPANTLTMFAQPAVHSISAWGMRDLCTDGQNIAGGSEAGISILDSTGAALAALGVPRGLAWDGASNGGNGSFFAVNFESAIYEFDRTGAILGTWPNR